MRHAAAGLALALMLAAGAMQTARAEPELNSAAAASAQSVARALLRAYRDCNRAAAQRYATPATVRKLFGPNCQPGGAKVQFMGCERGRGAGYTCFYYYEGGGINLRLVPGGPSGYRAVSVNFVAD